MSFLLRRYSTIKIGGEVEKHLFLSDFISSKIDLESLPKPIRVLGNGSNILIDDQGLSGTVILTREDRLPEPQLIHESSDKVVIRVASGMFLPALARWTARQGLSGCEYMIGVPGSLGGAVVQNAGANDQELSLILVQAEVLDLQSGRRGWMSVQDCHLEYRSSHFLKSPHFLVLQADLQLEKGESSKIESQTQLNLDYRKQKTPYSKPTLGSTFIRLKTADGSWIFPGMLIEEAGLKGFRMGQMSVSEVHANYIVNEGGATFKEALALIEEIEKQVFEKTNIRLEREILVWSDRLV